VGLKMEPAVVKRST